MNVTTIPVGYLKANCYLLEKENQIIVIDPGDEFIKIKEKIGLKKVVAVILTHRHFDHVGALEEIVKNYQVKVYDASNLKEGKNIISPFEFSVIFTKGHSDDSITIYFENLKLMFTGDFLFKGTVGRCDLGGNILDMKKSIDKIKKYPNCLIYPGHGPTTYLQAEIENNPYFKEDYNV